MKLLVVEDRIEDFNLTKDILEALKGLHEIKHVPTMIDFEKEAKTNLYDLILLDLCLPETQGLPTVYKANTILKNTINDHTPYVVLTGVDDFSVSKEALKYGAKDYLIKGQFGVKELQRAMSFATISKNNPKRNVSVLSKIFSA